MNSARQASRLSVAHTQALTLAKRAVFALGAAEKAIRQLDDLLEREGVPLDSPARQELKGLVEPEASPSETQSVTDWQESWWRSLLGLTQEEGDRAARAGAGEQHNPYASYSDADGKRLAFAWLKGHRDAQKRRAAIPLESNADATGPS